MSLELISDTIKVKQLIGEDSTQAVIENDIIVPDVKPDIANILLADGDILVNNAEAMEDKILLNGTIRHKILYLSDDQQGEVKSITNNSMFSYPLDIQGVKQGMKCKAKCDIEHIDYEVLNGRKVNIKAILSINGKAYDVTEHDVPNNLQGLDDIQLLRQNAEINAYVGDADVSCTVREALEIPSGKPTIREILRNDVKITGKDYKVTEDRIIAKGELSISTLYIGDDEERSIQFMEHEVPFTQFLDLDGIDEGSACDVSYRITGLQFEAAEDSDGELRVLDSEVLLNISTSAYNKRSIDVIDDAYSPYMRVAIEKELFSMEETTAQSNGQAVIKNNVVIEENQPEIQELYNVISKPSLSECKVMDEKVIVEGVVNNSMLYLSKDNKQPVCCYQQEMPFKQVIDVKGIKANMSCDVSLNVEHCSYSMISAKEIEVRLVIGVAIKASATVTIPIISDINEEPIDNKKLSSRPSIIIYFAQPGDNLWKIAKRYFVTIDDIQRMNNLTDRDTIVKGQQIIIPR